jgi:hypothetical protein
MAKAKKKQYIYVIDDRLINEQHVFMDTDQVSSYGNYSIPDGMVVECDEHGYSQREYMNGVLTFTVYTEGRHKVNYAK